MRRRLVQVHLWVGIASGLYVCVVCLTGAALVFRIDMQRARHPHLFAAAGTGPLADPVRVIESVSRAYPNHRLSGVEAPTSRRPTYLAYVTREREFSTVLIDPISTAILGELPEDPLIASLQQLHFNLMAGRTGRSVNGIGAACVLVMCATGVVIWWPGRRQWRRGFTVDAGRDWKRIAWELHRAVGIWTVVFLAMFAITGLSFVFPAGFRRVVHGLSPISVNRPPISSDAAARAPRMPSEIIARARQEKPGQHVARVVMPFNERAAFLIMLSAGSPTPAGSALSSVYLDQYSGEVLAAPATGRTAGDVVMAWVTPLHVGGFGGAPVRWLWLVLGLVPPLLFVSGSVIWWTRVVRPGRG